MDRNISCLTTRQVSLNEHPSKAYIFCTVRRPFTFIFSTQLILKIFHQSFLWLLNRKIPTTGINMMSFGSCQAHFPWIRIIEHFVLKNMESIRNLSAAIRVQRMALHVAGLNFGQRTRQLGCGKSDMWMLYASTTKMRRTKTECVQRDPCWVPGFRIMFSWVQNVKNVTGWHQNSWPPVHMTVTPLSLCRHSVESTKVGYTLRQFRVFRKFKKKTKMICKLWIFGKIISYVSSVLHVVIRVSQNPTVWTNNSCWGELPWVYDVTTIRQRRLTWSSKRTQAWTTQDN